MRKSAGLMYLYAGVLLYAIWTGVMLAGGFVLLPSDVGVFSILVSAGGLGIVCSALLLRRGFRILQPVGEEVLRNDKRPPILYLRSFLDDAIQQRFQRVKTGTLAFMPDPRAEESLAPLLNCLGPFVAIGKPGETLPQMGAYRLYVGDTEWKSKVEELMSRCSMTIMLGRTTTKGVHWEIQQAAAALRPEQLVFFFPFQSDDREPHYRMFKESVQQYFPCELPETLASNYFLRFQEGWRPRLLGAASRNPARAMSASLLAMVKEFEPNFQKPPFWKIISNARLYVFIALVGITLIAILLFSAYEIHQIIADW